MTKCNVNKTLRCAHTPAVCGDTLVAAVLLVPVFAVHGRVGAAGAYADAPAGGGSHARH